MNTHLNGKSKLNGGKCVDNFLYSESGTVYCQCPKFSEHRQMYFQGFEKDRNALNYRRSVVALILGTGFKPLTIWRRR